MSVTVFTVSLNSDLSMGMIKLSGYRNSATELHQYIHTGIHKETRY